MQSKRSKERRRIKRIQHLCSQLNDAIESSEELRGILERLADEAGAAADALEPAPPVVYFRAPPAKKKK